MTALRNGLRSRQIPTEVLGLDIKKLESKRCKFERCISATRGDKDYCSDHVLENTYAKHLIVELANREREDQQVRLKGSVAANIGGITSNEILLELGLSGPRTIERITRELNIDQPLVYNYAIALKKSGKIRFYSSSRGSLVLCLMGQEGPGVEAAVCA